MRQKKNYTFDHFSLTWQIHFPFEMDRFVLIHYSVIKLDKCGCHLINSTPYTSLSAVAHRLFQPWRSSEERFHNVQCAPTPFFFQVLINTSTWDAFPLWRARVPHKHHAECDAPQQGDKMTLKLQWALNLLCISVDVQQHADFHFHCDYITAWAQSAARHALIRSSTESWGSQLYLTHTSHTGTKCSETNTLIQELKGLTKNDQIPQKSWILNAPQINQSIEELWPRQL